MFLLNLRQFKSRAFLERVFEAFGEDVDRVVDQRRLRQDQLQVEQSSWHQKHKSP